MPDRPRRRDQKKKRGRLSGRRLADNAIREILPQESGGSVLLIPGGGTSLARDVRALASVTSLTVWYLDAYPAQRVIADMAPDHHVRPEALKASAASWDVRTDEAMRVVCDHEPPNEAFDAAILVFVAGSESELIRDQLQSAFGRLNDGGTLLVGSDHDDRKWLHDQLREMFGKVTVLPTQEGIAYKVIRRAAQKKLRPFECDFAFRAGERKLLCYSEPGVFSHRRIDAGARVLIRGLQEALAEILPDNPRPRMIDLGCGSGAVAMAAAVFCPAAEVLAVDSNARAIRCTQIGASRNQISNIRTLLNADGILSDPGSWDLVLTNPPYFSNQRIADIMVSAAERALCEGGVILLVTKAPAWFADRVAETFDWVETSIDSNYTLLTGIRNDSPVRYDEAELRRENTNDVWDSRRDFPDQRKV